jgi:uncharacterized membrane-anchored protein
MFDGVMVRHGKVPRVTLVFWVTKIAATTLGETGGDAMSMTLKLGYEVSSLVFLVALIGLLALQLRARVFRRSLYWSLIVATTMAGTTIADFADRSLGIGYVGGSLILAGLLAAELGVWKHRVGAVSFEAIDTPLVEAFYWGAILFSNTLGTALGDFLADKGGLGYEGGALVFAAGLAIVAGLYVWTSLSRTLLFWAAFILTRPLGATVGDVLTKAHAQGGLNLSRITSSLAIAAVVVALVALTPRLQGRRDLRAPYRID